MGHVSHAEPWPRHEATTDKVQLQMPERQKRKRQSDWYWLWCPYLFDLSKSWLSLLPMFTTPSRTSKVTRRLNNNRPRTKQKRQRVSSNSSIVMTLSIVPTTTTTVVTDNKFPLKPTTVWFPPPQTAKFSTPKATRMVSWFRCFLLILGLLVSVAKGIEPVRYQAEDANLYNNVKAMVGDNLPNSGYNNKGYADFGGQGSYVQWHVRVPTTGDYELTLRYSAPEPRPVNVKIDDNNKGSFPTKGTGNWNTWNEESMTINLSLGTHTIRIEAAGANGPNVDWISLGLHSDPAPLRSTVLEPRQELERGQFRYSPDRAFRTGLDANGQLVIQDTASSSVVWRSGSSGGERVLMQDDGNLVVRNSANQAVWNSETFGPGAKYALDDRGVAAVFLGNDKLWLASKVATALTKQQILTKGTFKPSPRGTHRVGLDQDGQLTVLDNSLNQVWSSGVFGGEICIMQGDGNLVVKNGAAVAIWSSKTSGNDGARLTIDDNGMASIMLGESVIWTTSGKPTSKPLVRHPNLKKFDSSVVLKPRASLPKGRFVSSPANKFKVGLNSNGELLFQSSDSKTLWNANIRGGIEAYMQPDGNFVVRDGNQRVLWTSHTSKNDGARLEIDDGGRLAIMNGQTTIWIQGVPRGRYDGPSSADLQFPLRTTFYYPWYPETWTVNGKLSHYIPVLGEYSSDDAAVVENHIDQMEYGYMDLVVASWWGPDEQQERSRISLLMDKTIEMKSEMKWSVYHEKERDHNPSALELRSDLDYLKTWFAWHPAFAHKSGKPMIFVYNESGCSVAQRWMEASRGEWFVVLKLFPGYKFCPVQPDSWHQYGPATEVIHIKGVTTAISPGFWRAHQNTPILPRVPPERFCRNVEKMVNDGEEWQVVTTFNEQGEGTSIEATDAWIGSDSTKYGRYLDCLHRYH